MYYTYPNISGKYQLTSRLLAAYPQNRGNPPPRTQKKESKISRDTLVISFFSMGIEAFRQVGRVRGREKLSLAASANPQLAIRGRRLFL